MADQVYKRKLRSSVTNTSTSPKVDKSKSTASKKDREYIPTPQELANPSLLICPCEQDLPGTLMTACTKCNQWWHNKCTNLGENKKVSSKTKFTCIFCFLKGTNNIIQTKVREIVDSNSQTETVTTQAPVQEDITSKQGVQTQPDAQITELGKEQQHVVIIDNIGTYRDFHKSSDIKREIARCKPDLSVSLAYPLPRGGIALVCPTQEDQKKALGTWPDGAFDSQISPHQPSSESSYQKLIIRSVHTALSDESVSVACQHSTGETPLYVRRLLNKNSHHPLPLCEIACTHSTAATLISKGLVISGTTHSCEPKRAYRVTCCYNCQAYGHVAKFCKNAQACCNCSQTHAHAAGCTLPVRCANCGGAHPADHNKCPTYLEVQCRLRTRCHTTFKQ